MSRATISAALAAKLTAAGISKVYERERYKTDWADFLALYKTSTGKINGFTVSRQAKARRSVSIGQAEECHVFVVRGYLGLQDAAATEVTFQDQCDAIDAAILADDTLAGSCETTHPDWGPMANAVGLQMDIIEIRMFGTVLCHYFEGRVGAVALVDL